MDQKVALFRIEKLLLLGSKNYAFLARKTRQKADVFRSKKSIRKLANFRTEKRPKNATRAGTVRGTKIAVFPLKNATFWTAREPARDLARDLARDPARDPARDLARDPARDPARGLARDPARDPARDTFFDARAGPRAGDTQCFF